MCRGRHDRLDGRFGGLATLGNTLALDVYGTLIDPLGIGTSLREHIGELAPEFARRWRDKQIEYLYRRALMRRYVDFPTCTRQALAFVDAELGTRLTRAVRGALLARYRALPAYPEVPAALAGLAEAGHRLYAFSNGHSDDLEHLLEQADIADSLDGVVSVHAVQSYKPDPAVYEHFLAQTDSAAESTWLVSGNPFDVIGASSAGWHAAWIRRDPNAVFDPWGIDPDVTVAGLTDLDLALAG